MKKPVAVQCKNVYVVGCCGHLVDGWRSIGRLTPPRRTCLLGARILLAGAASIDTGAATQPETPRVLRPKHLRDIVNVREISQDWKKRALSFATTSAIVYETRKYSEKLTDCCYGIYTNTKAQLSLATPRKHCAVFVRIGWNACIVSRHTR